MKLRIEGEDFEFQEDTLTVKEARLLKKHAGMGLTGFVEGVKQGDPDALVGIVFLAKRRAGVAVRWEDLDNLDLAKLEAISEVVDDQGADASDPLWPTGETPNSA